MKSHSLYKQLHSKLYKPEISNLHGKPSYKNLPKDLSISQVLMIRHASSTSNKASSQLFEEARKSDTGALTVGRWLSVYGDEDLVDARLTREGIQQCQVAAEHAHQIDFKQVYVSPLRRTMETAYHIFKDRPNFKSIKFTLAPEIREKIGISGDIPLSNQEWLRAYDLTYKDMFNGRL